MVVSRCASDRHRPGVRASFRPSLLRSFPTPPSLILLLPPHSRDPHLGDACTRLNRKQVRASLTLCAGAYATTFLDHLQHTLRADADAGAGPSADAGAPAP